MNEAIGAESEKSRPFQLTRDQVRRLRPDDSESHTAGSPDTITVSGRLILRRTVIGPNGVEPIEFYELPEVDGVAILAPDAGSEVYDAVKAGGGGSALLEPSERRSGSMILVPRSLITEAHRELSSPNIPSDSV